MSVLFDPNANTTIFVCIENSGNSGKANLSMGKTMTKWVMICSHLVQVQNGFTKIWTGWREGWIVGVEIKVVEVAGCSAKD